MKTHVIDGNSPLTPAIEAIKKGQIIAIPTETVYGLAADPRNEKAVGEIFKLKERPLDKPLSILVSGMEDVLSLCRDIDKRAYTLAEKFWPGPLTMVLWKNDEIPDIVTGGGKTIGVRCPDNKLALNIIKGSAPLAAPSANISNLPSPVTAAEVLSYFEGKIPYIVDGGRCDLGIESTVLDLTSNPAKILRRGALTKRNIIDAIGTPVEGDLIFGITGGTGGGKTTALRALESLGAVAIDCDAVYHDLLGDKNMLGEIENRFPGVVKDNALDRKALGEIVFADETALGDLNRITHKYVDQKVWEIIKIEGKKGKTVFAIDAIALIESGLGARCDYVVGVTAPAHIRAQRIMERDGIDREMAEKRIAAQKNDEYYEQNCDVVLINEGSENDFIYKCREYLGKIMEEMQ